MVLVDRSMALADIVIRFSSKSSPLAPELAMVNLQLLTSTADLTSPTIALQHLPGQFLITALVELNPSMLGRNAWS